MTASRQLEQRMRPRQPRPNPEKLLARLKAEEEQSQRRRGHLRIYLGASSGVGKTFAMLNEGRRRRDRRTADVVIGCLQTYGRLLTCEAADGLEALVPFGPASGNGRGDDLDVGAVLARRPTLVLVDELEHRNAPASKHEMRWQDVEEILDAGISVITTLNVEHLESLREQVRAITGAPVVDTVPDQVLDGADDVELIDMTPDALRTRLRHGNICPVEDVPQALEGRFHPETLAALRKLALRRTAREVESQLQRYMRAHDLSGWRVDERVLVCVDDRPLARTLIHRGRLMAQSFEGPLTVVGLRSSGCSGNQLDALADHLRQAREIGADVREIIADDPVDAIVRTVAELQITQVLVGHAPKPRWLEPLHASPVSRLLRRLPDVDIHIIAPPER